MERLQHPIEGHFKQKRLLEAEITRISDTTSWGGIKLLDGSLSDGITFQAGTKEGETIVASIQIWQRLPPLLHICRQISSAFTNAQSYITS